MFSSKKLGDCNPRTQRNTPTSTNAGYAHAWLSSHVSPGSAAGNDTQTCDLYNFARDTCSPTEDLAQRAHAVRAQLADTGSCQCLFRAATELTRTSSLTSRTQPPAPSRPTITQFYTHIRQRSDLVLRDATPSYPRATRQTLRGSLLSLDLRSGSDV